MRCKIGPQTKHHEDLPNFTRLLRYSSTFMYFVELVMELETNLLPSIVKA